LSDDAFAPWFVGLSKRQVLALAAEVVLAGALSTWLLFALLTAQGESDSIAISTLLFNTAAFALLALAFGAAAGGLGSLGTHLSWRTASPRTVATTRFWLVFVFAFAPMVLMLCYWALGSLAK
jgi:hypothetical protein